MKYRSGVVLAIVLASGCVKTNTKQCGDFVCSEVSVCAPSGDFCVSQTQIDACAPKVDGDGCSFPGTNDGVCQAGVCIGAGCGNGIKESESDEVCDDGNRISNDGCRSDCKSAEVCGDGVVDPAAGEGEQCDCGSDPLHVPVGCSGINSMDENATCRLDCKPRRCGDGVPDDGEFCDDGNNIAGDGCRADCSGRWTLMTSATLADVLDVSAVTKDLAFAVTDRRVLRWNGSMWSTEVIPSNIGGQRFKKVYAVSADELFLIGPNTTTNRSEIVHVKAGVWTKVTPAETGVTWLAIAGSGTNVWATGFGNTSNPNTRTAKWDGTTMIDGALSGYDIQFTSLSVSANGTVWAAEGDTGAGNVQRYSNGWASLSSLPSHLLAATSASDVFSFNSTGGSHSTDGSAANPVFVAIPNSYELSLFQDASAVPDYVIVVGDAGAVMICDTTTAPGTCEASTTGISAGLLGVSVIDRKHAFIVGAAGTILY